MNKKNDYKISILIIIILTVLCLILIGVNNIEKTEKNFEENKSDIFTDEKNNSLVYIKEICKDANIKIKTIGYRNDKFSSNTLYLIATFDKDKSNEEIYFIVRKINEAAYYEYESNIVFNGIKYTIFSYDKDNMEIEKNGKIKSYIYTSKSFLNNLKNIEPMKGLSEKYINKTSFGKYDKLVQFSNMNRYYWFYNKDTNEVKAIVDIDQNSDNFDDETGEYKISDITTYKRNQYYFPKIKDEKNNNEKKYTKSQLEEIAGDYDDYESFYYDYSDYITYEEAYELWIDNHDEYWDSEENMDSEW